MNDDVIDYTTPEGIIKLFNKAAISKLEPSFDGAANGLYLFLDTSLCPVTGLLFGQLWKWRQPS